MDPSAKAVKFSWPESKPRDWRDREDRILAALRRLAKGTPFEGRELHVVIGLSEKGWQCERLFAPDKDEDCPHTFGKALDARLL